MGPRNRLVASLPLAFVLLGAAARPTGLVSMNPPAASGALAPAWATASSTPALSWLERTDSGGHRLRLSLLRDGAWTVPVTIAEGPSFFANWADVPAVAFDGNMGWAHWLEKNGSSTYAYTIALARSEDQGKTWRRVGFLNDDEVAAEHGFVSWLSDTDGLRAVWLDGRGTPGGGPMTLRTRRVDAGPARPSSLLDDRVCDCCSTTAVATTAGLLVAYRDRSNEEIRDIAVLLGRDHTWSESRIPNADHWKIPGCPVNGPSLGAQGKSVVLAWFTGAPSARVQVAFSRDGGATFGPATLLDDHRPLGRVQAVAMDETHAAVSWLAEADGVAELRVARISSDGATIRPLTLARTGASRTSGVPRLLLDGQRLLVAWLETAEDPKLAHLRVTAVPLSAFGN